MLGRCFLRFVVASDAIDVELFVDPIGRNGAVTLRTLAASHFAQLVATGAFDGAPLNPPTTSRGFGPCVVLGAYNAPPGSTFPLLGVVTDGLPSLTPYSVSRNDDGFPPFDSSVATSDDAVTLCVAPVAPAGFADSSSEGCFLVGLSKAGGSAELCIFLHENLQTSFLGGAKLNPSDSRVTIFGRVVRGRVFLKRMLPSFTAPLAVSQAKVLRSRIANPVLEIETSSGAFRAALFADLAPVTCANIANLARTGFYNGTHVHRLAPSFVLQLGCPNTKDPKSRAAGQGGPVPNSVFDVPVEPLVDIGCAFTDGEAPAAAQAAPVRAQKRDLSGKIPDEFLTELCNEKYTLAMANSGTPNSGGSQFFVNLSCNRKLDFFDASTAARHPVFGCVVPFGNSRSVVDAIASNTKVGANEAPLKPIKVIRVSLVPHPFEEGAEA